MSYATTRCARRFLDAHQEYKFSCQMLGMANTTDNPQWTKARAMKCINANKRRRKLAKDKLDRIRKGGV